MRKTVAEVLKTAQSRRVGAVFKTERGDGFPDSDRGRQLVTCLFFLRGSIQVE